MLVVAVHPDDETLGCGGTLLRFKEKGDAVHWLVATEISETLGFTKEQIAQREKEIATVSEMYGFDSIHRLGLLCNLPSSTFLSGEMFTAITVSFSTPLLAVQRPSATLPSKKFL